jgi:hypothetical protein
MTAEMLVPNRTCDRPVHTAVRRGAQQPRLYVLCGASNARNDLVVAVKSPFGRKLRAPEVRPTPPSLGGRPLAL